MSSPAGRTIVRTHDGPAPTDIVDVATVATVEVTSENELFPIDHLFDGRSGPGGSCWVAGKPGTQTLVLRFHAPVDIATVTVESEERGITCTQQLDVAGWSEHRQAPFEAPPRVLHYSPYGPSFHRETWEIGQRGVSHLWMRITPAPLTRLATLTALVLRR